MFRAPPQSTTDSLLGPSIAPSQGSPAEWQEALGGKRSWGLSWGQLGDRRRKGQIPEA